MFSFLESCVILYMIDTILACVHCVWYMCVRWSVEVSEEERYALIDAGAVLCGTMALYMTINFSHGENALLERVDEHLHKDRSDQSSSILVLCQDPSTPPEHAISWYCNGKLTPVRGMHICVFNGRSHFHGVIPPLVFCSTYPWFGAALVRKYSLHK